MQVLVLFSPYLNEVSHFHWIALILRIKGPVLRCGLCCHYFCVPMLVLPLSDFVTWDELPKHSKFEALFSKNKTKRKTIIILVINTLQNYC